MKRTAEKVLSWIGIVFGILGIILFAASKPLFNPDKVDTDALKSDQSPEQARQGAEHMGGDDDYRYSSFNYYNYLSPNCSLLD